MPEFATLPALCVDNSSTAVEIASTLASTFDVSTEVQQLDVVDSTKTVASIREWLGSLGRLHETEKSPLLILVEPFGDVGFNEGLLIPFATTIALIRQMFPLCEVVPNCVSVRACLVDVDGEVRAFPSTDN